MAKPLTRKQKVTRAITGIFNKSKGAINISPIADLRTPFHIRRPTGLTFLDIKLGGGFPGGSIIQIHGRDGTGKNLTTYLCFIVSLGYKPDVTQMRLCGMKLAWTNQELEEQGIDPTTATPEQRGHTVGVVEIIELGANSKEAQEAPSEHLLEGVYTLAETGYFQMGLIDELGSGETKDGIAKKFYEHPKVAAWSGLFTRFVQRMYTVYRKPVEGGEPNDLTLIVLNPARAYIPPAGTRPSKYTKPDGQTSGFALAHAKAIDFVVSPGGQLKSKTVIIGKHIRYKLKKGKNGIAEGFEGMFAWDFEHGIDLVHDLVLAALSYDVIFKHKAWWYVFDDPEAMCRKKEEIVEIVRERMEADPTLFQRTKDEVMAVARGEGEGDEGEGDEGEEEEEGEPEEGGAEA